MEGRLTSGAVGGVTSAMVPATRTACVLAPTPAPSTTFVAATEWLDSGIPVVSITGELDLATASVLEEALLALPDTAEDAVIIDLTRCSFIDLRGLRVLLAAQERLASSHRPLALVAGNPSLLRVFKITRVDDVFEIHPSLAAAERNGYG